MSVITGFVIAILAGWLVPDARRAAITAAVPWLVVVAAQTWGLALGYGTSPPSTVERMPDLIGYWMVQIVFFAISVGIAAELGALRAGHGEIGRRFPLVAVVLTSAAVVFAGGDLLVGSPQPHTEEGMPPIYGVGGMVLSLLTLIVLSAILVRRRRGVRPPVRPPWPPEPLGATMDGPSRGGEVFSASRAWTWTESTVGGVGVLDLAAAALLGGYAFGRVYAASDLAAGLGVLAMTVPVGWRRPMPIAAAATLAVAAPLNGVLFGPLVRCGTALPAVFLVAYSLAAHTDRARFAATGLLLCVANLAAQCAYDPQLGLPVIPLMALVLLAFFASGRLVRTRTAMTEQLRLTSVRLREQRERTAQLAVRAERARIADGLSASLRTRIERIATTAAAGIAAADADAGRARQHLTAIEEQGRATLQRMREVLGTSQDDPPGRPQPTLAELAELLGRATAAQAKLTVEGRPQTLPAGLELSGYRIVEHLLTAVPDAPGVAVAVTVRFDPEALVLRVSGPVGARAETGVPLAAARERA